MTSVTQWMKECSRSLRSGNSEQEERAERLRFQNLRHRAPARSRQSMQTANVFPTQKLGEQFHQQTEAGCFGLLQLIGRFGNPIQQMAPQEFSFGAGGGGGGLPICRVFGGIAQGREKLKLGNQVIRHGLAGVGAQAENFVEEGVLQGNLLGWMSFVV